MFEKEPCMNAHITKTIAVLAVAAFLSACGNTKGQRALSGGAIGAGAGTVGAVLLNANPMTGAVLGAAAGAVTGAMTSKKNIDLGDIE
jgi:osmotically inducible lipoprotein OsmB